MRPLFFCTTLLILTSSVLKSQSIEDKIGQMIMVGFGTSQKAQDSLMYDIENRNLGGVLMFAYNLDSPSQIKSQNARLQNSAANHPLFISIDQEGGIVARLDEQNGYKRTFSAYDLGYTFDLEDSTRATAALMANWLEDGGFNINFAPVVDVNIDPNSPAIGRLDRSFSDNEFEVHQHAGWYINEFKKQGILSTLKHFPGHGSARNDSHFGFTDITSTWQKRELDPFRLLIEDGFDDLVMTGHLFKSDWDNTYPVSLSHYAISTMLRDSLNFEGLVISDELFMNAIQDNYGMEEAIVNTINAGTDILLFSTNIYNDISLPNYLITLISDKVASGAISADRIDAAYQRIVSAKQEKIITSSEEISEFTEKPGKISVNNYPNPFNPSTTVLITLLEAQDLSVSVYNSVGRKVRTLEAGKFSAGSHSFLFDASNLASGIYFVRITGNRVQKTHKMLLVK